jgi:general L-amino acid transport system permease protein
MAEATAQDKRNYKAGQHPDLPPPKESIGPIAWLRRNLFSSPINSLLTIAALYLLYLAIPPVLDWAIFSANWQEGTSRQACDKSGACWTMVRARLAQFVYGFYPIDERWRVDLTFLLAVGAIVPLLISRMPGKKYFAIFLFVVFPVLAYVLLYGGLGLRQVPTARWGGLMLTVILGGVGIVVSLPIGIVLALGRRSSLPVVTLLCTGFIEFVRAVPLITVLFMSSVMLPLFLPTGVDIDKLVRALVGIALFGAAYMAEVVRGGLQAIPRGQYEAAMALGLNYWKMTTLVILPQALRIVIPGIVNTFIGLFKDTTLVLIIGLFELLGIAQAATRDPNWIGLSREAFAFVAVVFFIFCFGMSRYSQYLERRLHTGYRR